MRVMQTFLTALCTLAGLAQGFSIDILERPSDMVIGGSTKIVVAAQSPPKEDITIRVLVDKSYLILPSQIVLPANSVTPVTIHIESKQAGAGVVKLEHNDVLLVKFNIEAIKIWWLPTFNKVIGWVYFVAWSVSFYPQVWINFRRKSVIGLSFEFLALNLLGWICYCSFNISLYWIPKVQAQYEAKFPGGAIPVEPNDVFFAIHAFVLTLITIFQYFIYERGDQKTLLPIIVVIIAIVILYYIASLIATLAGAWTGLEFITNLSYVKLGLTIIKYMPQAYFNWKRKSTSGWSIGNVLLDITGGILSMMQMSLIAFNANDWQSFIGNPTKFGLGLFSVLFDILFIIQHYGLYRKRGISTTDSIGDIGDDINVMDPKGEIQKVEKIQPALTEVHSGDFSV